MTRVCVREGRAYFDRVRARRRSKALSGGDQIVSVIIYKQKSWVQLSDHDF